MNYNKDAGERISQKEMDVMTERFQKAFPDATKSNFYGLHCFDSLLASKGVMGIQSVFGLDDEGNIKLIHIALDENGKRIGDLTGVIAFQKGQPCPPICQ